MFNDGDVVNIQSDGINTCTVFLTYDDSKVDIERSSAHCTEVQTEQTKPAIMGRTESSAVRAMTTACVGLKEPVEAKTGFTFSFCLSLPQGELCATPPCLVKTNISRAQIGKISIL